MSSHSGSRMLAKAEMAFNTLANEIGMFSDVRLDTRLPGHSVLLHSNSDDVELEALVTTACDLSSGDLFILVDPMRLNTTLDVVLKTRPLPANLHFGMIVHQNDSYYDAVESLTWLLATPKISRFLIIKGLPDELALDDLRPCGPNLPLTGDYNALDGNVYHAGTFPFRDSLSAFYKRVGKLDLVVMDAEDDSMAFSPLEKAAEDCMFYQCPLLLTRRFNRLLDLNGKANAYPFDEAMALVREAA